MAKNTEKVYQDLKDFCDNQPSHYALHLAAVNEKTPVQATQDICNSQGALLVRHGTRIDRRISDQILKHKLLRPLHAQVAISGGVDQLALVRAYQQFFAGNPELEQLHFSANFDHDFLHIVNSTQLPSLLWQKLTVMRAEKPALFTKSLFCSWFSVLLLREFSTDPEILRSGYLAGLLHDIGMMHIAPDVLNKREQLSGTEWRAIQSHVMVGYLIMRAVDEVPNHVARAVVNHHERSDGSGYPVGVGSDALDIVSRVIGAVDSIQAVLLGKLQRLNTGVLGITPFLQLNASVFGDDIYHAIMRLLRRAELGRVRFNPYPSHEEFFGAIERISAGLAELYEHIARVLSLEGQYADESSTRFLFPALRRAKLVFDSSGIVQQDFRQSVFSDNGTAVGLHGLSEAYLLQQELLWQIESSRKMMNNTLDSLAAQERSSCSQLIGLCADMFDLAANILQLNPEEASTS